MVAAGLIGVPAAARDAELVFTPATPFAIYEESHALLIGISDYTGGWPRLRGVREDIKAVDAALIQAGFATEIVLDPDRAGVDRAITRFIARVGSRPNNRLLFYYAGHGHTLKASYGGEMGYIVPRDAPNPNVDRAGFMASAISMQTIEIYARQIESKHALFVFDSCFSGSVFHPTRAIPDVVREKSAYPVRQFITSGAADQPVPDYSTFRRSFVAAITGQASIGKDGYLTGSQLGAYLEEKVTNYSRRTQTPQYGKLQDPNLDRGDFIFALPAGSTPMSPSAAEAEIVFWQTIASSTNPDDFAAYLQQYPNGRFAALAALRAQPSAVEAPRAPPPAPVVQAPPIVPPAAPPAAAVAVATPIVPPAPPVAAAPPRVSPPSVSPTEQARLAELALALPPEQRQSVQRWLSALGHDTGGTDGQFGPQTRKAIGAYQTAKAMPATGYLSAELVRRLSEDANTAPPSRTVARPPAPPPPVPTPTPTARPTVQSVATPAPQPKSKSPRCGDILQRLQLGEAVSDGDRAILRAECGQ